MHVLLIYIDFPLNIVQLPLLNAKIMNAKDTKFHKIFKSGFRPGLYKDKNTIKQEKFLFWLMLESHSKINYFAIREIPDLLNHNINEGKK